MAESTPNLPPAEASSSAEPLRPAPPPAWWATPPAWWLAGPKKPGLVRRMFRGLLALVFLLSIVLNAYLLLLVAASLDRGLDTKVLQAGDNNQVIAVYPLSGVIDDEQSARFSTFTRQVLKDAKVKAVVLRVNSPGGGVSSSDEIHQNVLRLKGHGKKVVVSMGGVAASGGYYVSAAADEILAEPTTATGSIGVIVAWPVLKGTLEKIGAEMVVMKSTHATPWKDVPSILQNLDDRQRTYVQNMLNKVQQRFEQVVKDGRGDRLAPKEVTFMAAVPDTQPDGPRQVMVTETEPFNGKVYLAEEAKALGMIDGIGYLDAAIDRAKDLAKLSSPEVVRYSPRHGLLTSLMGGLDSASGLRFDVKTLEEVQTPRLQMIWKVQ